MKLKSRQKQILKYAGKERRGIEVAPWHSPIAPKKAGHTIKSLDIFDKKTLVQRCLDDPSISDLVDNIEEVDFICSALDIADAVKSVGESGTYDYIISSHNFEHLPDPIRFLRACGEVLAPGGYLSMAVPDKRRTFDYVRAVSRTSDLLRSYYEKKTQPSPYDLFDGWKAVDNIPPQKIEPVKNPRWYNSLDEKFASFNNALAHKTEYEDCHVTVYTPESFKAIILELIRLDLIPFQLVEITLSLNHEFYVHLKNVGYGHPSRANITDAVLLEAYVAGFGLDADMTIHTKVKATGKRLWKSLKRKVLRRAPAMQTT